MAAAVAAGIGGDVGKTECDRAETTRASSILAKSGGGGGGGRRMESNQRPLDTQSNALPLSYASSTARSINTSIFLLLPWRLFTTRV